MFHHIPQPALSLHHAGRVILLSGLIAWGNGSVQAQSLEAYIDFSAENLPGRLYVPPEGLDPAARRPLMIALHGGGGIGRDNIKNIWDFEPLLNSARDRGVFLYAPQATTSFWDRADRPRAIMAQVDRAIAQYGIDPNRITVTGFSMGGGGAWALGSFFPDRFAAIMPICGISPQFGYRPAALSETPVWAFHARNDPAVPVTRSQQHINELIANAGLPVLTPPAADSGADFEIRYDSPVIRYTEWGSGGHAIWPRVYASEEAIEWLFTASLSAAEPSSKIITHPQSSTLASGSSLNLNVTTSGIESPTYQWTHDGQALVGATDATYTFTSLQSSDAGLYQVQVSDGAQQLTSRPAVVHVAAPQRGGLVNLSVRARLDANAPLLIAGFVTTGPAQERLIRAIGPTLGEHGVSDPLPDPEIELYQNINNQNNLRTTNQQWGGDDHIAQLTTKVGAFPLPNPTSSDAALVWSGTGVFTAHVSDIGNQPGTVLTELYTTDQTPAQSLINISARQKLNEATDVLIAGFVLGGNTPRQILIRAVGPGLAHAGVNSPVANPELRLFVHLSGEDILFAENTTWTDETNAAEMPQAVPGAFPLFEFDNDAALLLTLPAGVYTVHATSALEGSGDVLIEVYLADE